MDENPLSFLPTSLLAEYLRQVATARLERYRQLKESELTAGPFSFYTSVSAVFSSKIEGVDIELDSYVKHKRFGVEFQPDYTRKTDDLYNAYQFAKLAKCNAENIAEAHRLLTAHILPAHRQGKLRTGNMYVTTSEGKIEYVAASPFVIKTELDKFNSDLETLMEMDLSVEETFFFASLLHLVFVKIHPFDDGNGRTARLLEKWFLAEKLGEKAWLLQSEKNYYLHHHKYYQNIRFLGLEYDSLDYSKALPFLLMLPQSLAIDES
jgi:Fic family protein